MKTLQPLLIFSGKFFLAYLALFALVSITDFGKTYRDIYCSFSNWAYSDFIENVQINTKPLNDVKSGDDIEYTFANKSDLEKAKAAGRQAGQSKVSIKGFKWSFNTYRVELIFVLFFLSLIIAYPSDWKHKLKSLLIGLAIYFLISFSLLAGRLIYQVNMNKKIFPEYELSNFSEHILSTAVRMHTEAMFFITLLIWGIVMVRKKDFSELLK